MANETPKLVAKNDTQKEYIRAIKNKQLVIADGPAGTGKTTIAVAMAVQALRKQEIEKNTNNAPDARMRK